jgi:hypothetical protein
MALRIQTQRSGDVFIFLCDGRIVYGDEGTALRERVGLSDSSPLMRSGRSWIARNLI